MNTKMLVDNERKSPKLREKEYDEKLRRAE
jgi:hypothetical protein